MCFRIYVELGLFLAISWGLEGVFVIFGVLWGGFGRYFLDGVSDVICLFLWGCFVRELNGGVRKDICHNYWGQMITSHELGVLSPKSYLTLT